jgi:hypothetical protein
VNNGSKDLRRQAAAARDRVSHADSSGMCMIWTCLSSGHVSHRCASCGRERHAHEIHAYGMNVYKRHANGMHAYERHAHEMNVCERHGVFLISVEHVLIAVVWSIPGPVDKPSAGSELTSRVTTPSSVTGLLSPFPLLPPFLS